MQEEIKLMMIKTKVKMEEERWTRRKHVGRSCDAGDAAFGRAELARLLGWLFVPSESAFGSLLLASARCERIS